MGKDSERESDSNTCTSRHEGCTSGAGDMHLSLLGFQVWSSSFDALKLEEAVKPNSVGELVTVAELIVTRGLTFCMKDREVSFLVCCYH